MKTILGALAVLSLLILASSCISTSPSVGAAPEIGKPAPDFTVVGLDGKEVKLSNLRGKPVFLDFWATWCPPCRASLPHTQKLAANHGAEITVLAISEEDQKTIEEFEKSNGYNYPTFRDPRGEANNAYSVEGIPTFVIIDKDGTVVDYQSGYDNDEPLDTSLRKVGIHA